MKRSAKDKLAIGLGAQFWQFYNIMETCPNGWDT